MQQGIDGEIRGRLVCFELDELGVHTPFPPGNLVVTLLVREEVYKPYVISANLENFR